MTNETLHQLVSALGGAYKAAEVAGITPAWLYKCLDRGWLPAQAAYRMLLAAGWPVSRLADVTLPPEVCHD